MARRAGRSVLYVRHVGEMGGAAHSLVTLVANLDRSRYLPHAALPDADGSLARSLAAVGADVHAVPELRLLRRRDPCIALHLVRGRAALSGLAKSLRPDLIHANSDQAMLYVAPLHARGAWRIVWHIRDMQGRGLLTRYLVRPSDLRLAVSHAAARSYGLHLSERDRVVYNGVDLARFHPRRSREEARDQYGIPGDAKVVLGIGQDVGWKRHRDFLHLDAPDCVKLLVVYPPPGVRQGTATPDPCLKGVVTLPYQTDIERVYAAADVYVHTALGEAFGRTVVEALACGLPVVAYRHGGPAEIVEDGVSGLLVEPADTRALGDAVGRLLRDSDLYAGLSRGAAARGAEFGARPYADAVMDAYDALASPEPSARPSS